MSWLSIPTILHDPVHGYHEGYYLGGGEDAGLYLFRVDVESGENPWRVADTMHPKFSISGDSASLEPAPYTYGGKGVYGQRNLQTAMAFVFHSITLGQRILSSSLTEPYLIPEWDTNGEWADGTSFWYWPSTDPQPGQTIELTPGGMAQGSKMVTCEWGLYEPESLYQAADEDWPAGSYYNADNGKRVYVGSPQWECTYGAFYGETFVRAPISQDDEVDPATRSHRPFVGSNGHNIEYWLYRGFEGWRIVVEGGVFYLSENPPNIIHRGQGSSSGTVVFRPKRLDEEGEIVAISGRTAEIRFSKFACVHAQKQIMVGDTSIWR